MRVNSRVFTERTDMFNGIKIPNCPSQFKTIAENIMDMVTEPGYSIGDYSTMTELDKRLMLGYWRKYDGLDIALRGGFDDWFIHKATSAELLRRARQFLTERNYLLPKESVIEHAHEAGEKFSRAFKQ